MRAIKKKCIFFKFPRSILKEVGGTASECVSSLALKAYMLELFKDFLGKAFFFTEERGDNFISI